MDHATLKIDQNELLRFIVISTYRNVERQLFSFSGHSNNAFGFERVFSRWQRLQHERNEDLREVVQSLWNRNFQPGEPSKRTSAQVWKTVDVYLFKSNAIANRRMKFIDFTDDILSGHFPLFISQLNHREEPMLSFITGQMIDFIVQILNIFIMILIDDDFPS